MDTFTVKAITMKMPKYIKIISISKRKAHQNYNLYEIEYENKNLKRMVKKEWYFKSNINEVKTLVSSLKKSFEYKELEKLKNKLSKKKRK